jgi:hypothetical protein
MVRQAPSSFRVEVDQAELRKLVADLKTLEGGKKQVAALRKNLKAAAEPMKRQVQANASWSSRIPGAVGMQVRFTAKKVGVSVFVSRKKAPHARPIENAGRSGEFTHPLFGDPSHPVRQPARPFFFTEMARHMPEVEKACAAAIDEAARQAGFR